MSFINEVDIKMINDSWESGGYFNNWWEDEWYTVIDKQHLGQTIGKKICETIGKKIILENGGLNYDEIYSIIEDEYTNTLRNQIYSFVEEYLGENGIGGNYEHE